MKIEWHGEKVIDEIEKKIDKALSEIAELIADDARKLVPKYTGELGQSIEIKKSKYKNGGYIVEAYGSNDKYYASFIKLGTYKDQKQPYLRPALYNNKETFKEKLKQII